MKKIKKNTKKTNGFKVASIILGTSVLMVGAGIGVGHLLFNNSATKKVSYITAVTTGLTKKGDQSQKATITVTPHDGADLNKLKRISNTTDFNFSA
jgi:hypothetical protein